VGQLLFATLRADAAEVDSPRVVFALEGQSASAGAGSRRYVDVSMLVSIGIRAEVRLASTFTLAHFNLSFSFGALKVMT
jgi:hypothetical protein